MSNKQKLNKLCNIRTDLGDDGSHVKTINSAIQAVADDFEDLFKFDSCSTIKEAIEGLKESSQSNDENIKTAKSYCQYEINLVSAKIKNEEK